MLTGLRKRETYEELINELGDDPIKRYPNRTASQIENSNYMSQLASGFKEVIEQHDRVMKEQTKELLLQEIASSSSSSSHQSFRSLSSLGLNQIMQAAQRPPFIPIPRPQQFQIHSPRSEHSANSATSAQQEFRQQLFGPNIEPELSTQSLQNLMEIDDDARRQEERQRQLVTEVRHIHLGSTTTLDRMVPQQPDVNMDSMKDIMDNNIFEGVFSGGASSSNQVPVKKLVDKIEKKEEEMKEEKKKPGRPKKLAKPNDEPDDQPEKTQGRASSRSKRTANTPPTGRPEPKRKITIEKSDDEVELTGVTLNRNTSSTFWAQQSPNEMRAQLKLRNIPINDYAFLKKKDLVEFIRNLIRTNKW